MLPLCFGFDWEKPRVAGCSESGGNTPTNRPPAGRQIAGLLLGIRCRLPHPFPRILFLDIRKRTVPQTLVLYRTRPIGSAR
jgi:hypothetical protein